ncbi:L-glutamate gamma-semialdehyde dehydrogenase [Candidatus Oscillochloris fontis]|uniref:L-glutamate gamma-semialdehyde dehydrogenase n=1 Tax=Candidatus Oscillochloris fontis TaxID=2496868 RepID=UPI00101BC701|nr:L-glutamate gamma-semialdehyde dehydrogenase [Candidatus Oscillochloris fontis]
MLPTYSPEPFGDFSTSERRATMQRALRHVAGQFGATAPLLIGGEHLLSAQKLASYSPCEPKKVVGYVSMADQAMAHQAVLAAEAAFAQWRRVPVEQRAQVLLRAAAMMRRQKEELAAWIVYEVSKTWIEADADVAEAIDFCEYYARQALDLQGRDQPLTPYPGEYLQLRQIPLGPGLAIPPWNFPLAIATTLTVAPIVTGNTVVLKPSPRAPLLAVRLVEILEAAGLPPGVVNLVVGDDAVLGDFLVDHPQIRFIAFTGSKAVGLRVLERAAVRQPGQNWIKRPILEMGGKDAIIVDASADLSAAAEGVTAAAFGFQGQKCSACSRAIVVESVYDAFLQRLLERAAELRLGHAALPETHVAAVIDKRAFDMISEYIALGQEEGRLVLGGEVVDHKLIEDGGFFINPTIFADVAAHARIAQEEIFGPVLALIKAKDFDAALAIANDTEYGLTGALYSRDLAHLERARDEFHVGNLYLNRKCTGALVGIHPFGGFNMSGSNSKAGGPDYLRLFTQAKAMAERL